MVNLFTPAKLPAERLTSQRVPLLAGIYKVADGAGFAPAYPKGNLSFPSWCLAGLGQPSKEFTKVAAAAGFAPAPVLPALRFQGGGTTDYATQPYGVHTPVVIEGMIEEKSLAVHLLEKFTGDREKIERYSAIADLCPLPIFIVAHDGKSIVYVNPAYRQFTGRDIDELQDFKWLEMVHPDDRARVAISWKKFIEDEIPIPTLRRYVDKQGKTSEAVMTAYRVEQNGYVGFIVPRCLEGCFFMKMVSPAGIPPAT